MVDVLFFLKALSRSQSIVPREELEPARLRRETPAMAVYTTLTDAQLVQMLCVHEDLGAFVSIEGIAAGSINSMFKLTLENATTYLRIGENKLLSDLVYERNLLDKLQSHRLRLRDVQTPHMIRNCVGGTFFPVGDGKFAMLFAELEGRELGVFERTATQCAEVGAFLARAHLLLRRHKGRRKNPYRVDVVRRWVAALKRELLDQELAAYLDDVMAEVDRVRHPLLPRGVIHGDLFMNNTKWRRGHLGSVFDWEMAGTDHLALDLAITVLAWTWSRGTPGEIDPALARALIAGYQSVRPLRPSETRSLYGEFLLAALRFCASRVRDFHLDQEQGRESGDRTFLDYREYVERIEVVRALGRAGVADLAVAPEFHLLTRTLG